MEDTGPRQLPPLEPMEDTQLPPIKPSASPPTRDQEDGTVMRDFEVLKLLGKGAYGKALLCRDRRCREDEDDLVVVKQVTALNQSQADEARREAQILNRLDHPNVVAFFESFVETSVSDGPTLNIVMEFCDGGDLDQVIKARRKTGQVFDESYVMRIFVQLLLALKYVHAQKVLHRDIKPQNVFLTRTGLAKWGDFGVAKCLQHTTSMARTQTGTPYYLSPEIFNDEAYSSASDMWSLGVVLYELATLKLPFHATSLGKLARLVLGRDPPRPKKCSAGLGDLLGKMLCKRANQRPKARRLLRDPFVRHHAQLLLASTATGALEPPPPQSPPPPSPVTAPAAAPSKKSPPPPPRGSPPDDDVPEAPAPPRRFFVDALCLDEVNVHAPPAPTSARLWPLDGSEVLQAESPVEIVVRTPERSEGSPLRRRRRRELKNTARQRVLGAKLDAMRAQVDLLRRRPDRPDAAHDDDDAGAAARTLQRTWRRGRRPALGVVPPRAVHPPARAAAALIQRSWRRLPREAPRRGRPRRRPGVRETLRLAAEQGAKKRRDSEGRQRRQKRELEAHGAPSSPCRSRDASPAVPRASPAIARASPAAARISPGPRRAGASPARAGDPRDAISAAAARGAARRAQAEARASRLKAELEAQYGVARARIEAAATAEDSPSPSAQRKPRRASTLRGSSLGLDDVPEEPDVSTAGAAGRAVAAVRSVRDDVDVLALSGSLASMLAKAEDSDDDDSVAPPADPPPPDSPDDVVPGTPVAPADPPPPDISPGAPE